jgi:sortase A
MKVSVPRKSIFGFLRWSQIGLLAVGAGMLSYCVFVLADTWVFERQATLRFDRLRVQPVASASPGITAMGGLMGRIEIPRLGLSVAVAEGTEEATLRRAAGHILGTALPGRSGT